jgi:hypothetical protein
MWKEKKHNAKWNWIAKDVDYGLGLVHNRQYDLSSQEKVFNFFLRKEPFLDIWSNEPAEVLLFQRLMSIEKFRNQFIDRLSVAMGDFLKEESLHESIDSISSLIEYEYAYTLDRYADYVETQNFDWYEEISQIKKWVNKRIDFLYGDLRNFFQLGDTVNFSITKPCNLSSEKITINNIPLKTQKFRGKFFINRPLELEIKEDNYCWLISYEQEDQFHKMLYEDKVINFTIPTNTTNVTISILEKTSSESLVENKVLILKGNVDVYDFLGRKIGNKLFKKLFK